MLFAIMVLFIVAALTVAAVTVSMQTNSSTRRDGDVKSALAAAEAGLRVAVYRMNMLKPEGTRCVNHSEAVLAEHNGYCEDSKEALGNGATYTYWTSEELGSGGSCVGLKVVSQESVGQRCVVAEGVVKGTSRRVAERVASFTAKPLFPITGVTSLKELKLENNGYIKGSAGSNGKITINNNAEVSEDSVLGPSGEVSVGNNGSAGTVIKRSTAEGPLTLNAVEPGSSATENSDYYITNYKEGKSPVEPYDKAVSVKFEAATRMLTMENNAELILREGTYNFCSFEAKNNARIELAANAKVVIYIDSAKDPNSKCPTSGSGVFEMKNNGEIINPSKDPTALQIYVYDGSGGTVSIKNNAALYATLYAPQSTIEIKNNGAVNGAIAGNEVLLSNNFTFNWDSRDAKLKAGTVGISYRSAWTECTPARTSANNPESGC